MEVVVRPYMARRHVSVAHRAQVIIAGESSPNKVRI
jgi:hypothetical protein